MEGKKIIKCQIPQHVVIVAGKNHLWMLKLGGKNVMMNRIFVES